MRGSRLASKQGRSKVGGSMDLEKVDKDKEEPRLSGAYIRSLVKHLTSTTTAKDPLGGDGGPTKNINENTDCFSDGSCTQPLLKLPTQPPQHKKQVRRRLHTSRPYQERLLNMAEARREIVTALKFHRASMKQQEAVHNHDPQFELSPPPPPQPPPPFLDQEKKSKSRRNPRLYPSTTTATATAATATTDPYYWPISAIAPPPPPSYHDNLNLVLPNQTLGLNLNFQNFNNLDTQLYHTPLSIYSSSPPSTTPSVAAAGKPNESASNSSGGAAGGNSSGLHHAMDDEEMEEIRSLGEQHQIEWNDTINLVTSVRWCKFLKASSFEEHEHEPEVFHSFDQAMEFPSWLINSNESDTLQQHFDEHVSDAALPW